MTIDTPLSHRILTMQLLGLVSKYFKEANIPYFIDGGTLLGALREGEMIHHDDDVDIGVMHKYWDHVKRTLAYFDGLRVAHPVNPDHPGYLVATKVYQGMFKVYLHSNELWVRLTNINTNESRIIGTPTLDIFPWARKGDKIVLYEKEDRIRFPNCFYMRDELFPLKEYLIGDPAAPMDRAMVVTGAHDGMPYLHRYYGPDCMWNLRVDARLENDPVRKQTV